MRAYPMLTAAPLLLLLCLRGRSEGRSAGPGAELEAGATGPEPPARARFLAHTFQHVLHWAPGGSRSRGLLFDVQYRRYGNHSWTPVPRCTAITSHFCDLTDETREPSRRYFARVRAVAGNGTSPWTSPVIFSPKEATLQLWNMSLFLSGNTIQVAVGPPVHRWKNATITHEEVHLGGWGRYRVYVRRASDNFQYVLLESSPTFDLPELLWGERYCVSVELHLPSRPNHTKRTEEQCISTPPAKDHTRAMVLLSLSLLGLVALGVAGTLSVLSYMKRPVETPSVLTSLLKQPVPWMLSEMRGLDLCVEVESVCPISLGPEDHPHSNSMSHSGGAAGPAPEKVACWLPKASGQAGALRLGHLMDSSGCSTDSGICLQGPLGSLDLLLSTGPLGHRRGSLGSSHEGGLQGDRGLGAEESWLHGAPPSSEMEPAALDFAETLKQAGPPCAQLPGPRRQAGAPLEVTGSASCEGAARSQAVLPSGYLKQPSVAAPSGQGSLAVAQGASLGSTHGGKWQGPPSAALGSLESLPLLPEFSKARLVSGFFEQEPAWPPPALSLLRSSAQLPLSLPWGRV